MSTAPAATVVPSGKDAPATPPASIESKVAAAFKTEPPPPMPKAPTPPPNPATPATPKVETKPAEVVPPKAEVKPAPTLLPKKTPVAAPPTTEADPFEKYSLPETAPEEQRSQFTELKRISRAQHKELADLKAKVNAPTLPAPEVEKLRSEHKAALDRLAVLDLQSHPDFKRQYSEPKTKALAEVAEILSFSDKGQVDLNGLLGKDRKTFSAEVTKLTEGLNPMDATTVQTALRDAYRVSQDEKVALTKAGELSQNLARQSESQAKQAFEEVSSNLGPLGEFLVTLDMPEGATAEERTEIEDYNASVSNMRQNVEKTVFGRTDEKGMAVLGWKAGTLDFLLSKGIPRMEKNYAALVQSHAALTAELAAIKGAKGSGPVSGDPSKTSTAKTTDQMVQEAFNLRR